MVRVLQAAARWTSLVSRQTSNKRLLKLIKEKYFSSAAAAETGLVKVISRLNPGLDQRQGLL